MIGRCGDVIASSSGAAAPTSVHRGPRDPPKIRPKVSVVILRDRSHGAVLTKVYVAIFVILYLATHVKHDAGDDEHRRHRQHLRKRFRGRPLGGLLHTCLPRLSGVSHRRPRRLDGSVDFYSEHPATSIRFDESPLSEYRPCQGRTVLRRHFDSAVLLLGRPPDTLVTVHSTKQK